MPYLITTTTPDIEAEPARGGFDEPDLPAVPRIARRAVATLEEARHGAYERLSADYPNSTYRAASRAIEALGESGGTVGPLPDGTVIEIVKVTDGWPGLVAEDHGHEFEDPENWTVQEGIDAFNAREGS